MAITQYNINPVAHGVNGFGLQFSDTSYSVLLTADTDTTLTVPGAQATGAQSTVYAKFYAIMKYSTDGVVWVANNNTAEVPADDAFAQTTGELSPECKYVKSGDVLHFITSSDNIEVNVAFFAVQD